MNSLNLPDFPIVESLKNYSKNDLSSDFQAGLTVAFLAVPQCMAYALLAEMNPVYGLYAAFVGVVVASIFASSEIIITGPTAKVSLVVGSILVAYQDLKPIQSVIVLTVMVGVLQIAISLLGAGDLSAFVSHSVVKGFIVGGGLVIIGDQIIYLLDAAKGKSPYFMERVYEAGLLLWEQGSIPVLRLILGVGCIALILLIRSLHEALPSGIIAILIGGVISFWFDFDALGVDIVGSIPKGLPNLTIPNMQLQHFTGLFAGAFALTILGSVQTVSIAKSIARKTQSDIDENQELFSQGIANLVVGLFQGYPVSASFTRSFLNDSVGARTRLSGLLSGLFIALMVFLAAPYAYFLPVPVLAGLIIVVVGDIFEWSEIETILYITRLDRIAFLVTFVSVLIMKLHVAIYVGVAVTLIIYLKKSSQIDLREYRLDVSGNLEQITEPEDRSNKQIALIDVNGEIFFGAAERIRTRVRNLLDQSEELKVVILRLKNAMNIDSASVLLLKELALEMRDLDKTLLLSGVTPKIRSALVDTGVAEVIDKNKIFIAQTELLDSTKQAIKRAESYIEDVIEGDVDRKEEDPSLKHTLEKFLKDDDPTRDQDPVTTERVNPD